jgi:hypothetical protein
MIPPDPFGRIRRRAIETTVTEDRLKSDVKIASDWARANLKIVAFVQERKSRKVLATAVTGSAGL